MFVEKYFEIKEENLRQEGRRDLANKFRSLISSTEGDTFSIPKKDLLALLEEDDNK